MKVKLFEIRDRGTLIPVIAIRASYDDIAFAGDVEAQSQRRFLLGRVGWEGEPPAVLMVRMADGLGHFDPYDWDDWGDRTHKAAHAWIEEHWEQLSDGQVVDVRFILGEQDAPAPPDRLGFGAPP